MPTPWLVNAWACNPWQTESGRDASADTEVFSVLPPLTQEQIDANAPPADTDPGSFYSISAGEWAASLRKNWPEVPPFIPDSERIRKGDHAKIVLDWANSFRDKDHQREKPECFDYAAYQVSLKDCGVSDAAHLSPSTHAVLVEYPDGKGVRQEVRVDAMVAGLVDLKEALPANIPVLIGIQLTKWSYRPNNYDATDYIEPTNHYIVAIGMGKDEYGCYISYLDSLKAFSDWDRLYLRDDLTMTSFGGGYLLTEIRRSTKY